MTNKRAIAQEYALKCFHAGWEAAKARFPGIELIGDEAIIPEGVVYDEVVSVMRAAWEAVPVPPELRKPPALMVYKKGIDL